MLSSITRDDILTALRLVILPGTNTNIVEARRVSGITLRGAHVGFVLEAEASEAGTLEEACKRALGAFPDVTQVSIVTTNHQNAGETTPTPLRSDGRRQQRDNLKTPLPGVARIIAIASGKGGVGKSSLTMLLAHALAARGEPVAILDADIHGPSIPRMLGLESTPPALHEGLMVPAMRHGIKANSIGLVGGDTAAIWRGPMVTKALHQLLRMTDWTGSSRQSPVTSHQTENFMALKTGATAAPRSEGTGIGAAKERRRDAPSVSETNNVTLLIDLPPGTGDIQLTLMQSAPVSAAIIVTTPQEIALADARKAASMFRSLHIPILGVVENMSYFETPDGMHHTLFGAGGGERLADAFSVPLLAQLPLDPAIGSALDMGENPLTEPLAMILRQTVDALLLV